MKAHENPFNVQRIEKIRYNPLDTTIPQLLDKLEQLNYRAAIAGPEGSGKTTLLEDLKKYLKQKNINTINFFINDTNPCTSANINKLIESLNGDEIVLLDGADLISPLKWLIFKKKILKHAAGLIITTHKPSKLPVLIECRTTVALFKNIVKQLIGGEHSLDCADLEQIYDSHNGNIRSALAQLYDIWAEMA